MIKAKVNLSQNQENHRYQNTKIYTLLSIDTKRDSFSLLLLLNKKSDISGNFLSR